ncbi:GNAT family N-acetyltransferase [Domibacillus iocasae]|uniref:GNAT family N-acetyltransferase n=1 Tax=Domibacillus iocasae TaxID=1714016 RepID=UPI001FDF2B43|nr:GNAT family N-acetyltransferase [Domibacillus iocasae]
MQIKYATPSDAPTIHYLMIKAFEEYKDEVPLSSALEETTESITAALEDGEQALISYIHDEPVGMIRFRLKENGIYFYRLSVIPENQGKGIAKKLLKSLEEHAEQIKKTKVLCKVRMTVPKNIKLYNSLGYRIYDEELVYKPNGINIKVVSMMKQL